jgi:hypothetical protein
MEPNPKRRAAAAGHSRRTRWVKPLPGHQQQRLALASWQRGERALDLAVETQRPHPDIRLGWAGGAESSHQRNTTPLGSKLVSELAPGHAE